MLELTAEDPIAIEGLGPTQVVEYLVEFEGTLHIWTESELDLFLRVDNVVEMTPLAEDDNSGGGKTPYLQLEVNAGDQLAVFVAGQANSTGLLTLNLVAAPETSVTREAGAAAQQKAKESSSWGAVIAELECVAGWETNQVIADAFWAMGFDAYRAGELGACSKAWTKARWHRERTLPEDHPDLLSARAGLAVSMATMGDLAAARALLPLQYAGMRARVLASLALSPREVRQVVAAEGHRLAGAPFLERQCGIRASPHGL